MSGSSPLPKLHERIDLKILSQDLHHRVAVVRGIRHGAHCSQSWQENAVIQNQTEMESLIGLFAARL